MIGKPIQEKLLASFRANIRNRVWSDFLPPLNELAGTFSANPKTIAKVIGILAEEGLVEARRGVGTVIRASAMAQRPRLPAATVCLPLYRTEFYSTLGTALLKAARARDLALRVFDYDADEPEAGLHAALEYGDRLVVFYPNLHMPANLRRAVRDYQERGRIVFIDTVPDKLTAPEVRTDHRGAGALAAQHLADAGYQPVFLASREGYVFRLRQLGFEDAALERGATWPVYGVRPQREAMLRLTERLLRRQTPAPLAFLADNAAAAGILRQCLADRGVAASAMPVATFDPPPWFAELKIRAIRQYPDRIAQTALDLLFARDYRKDSVCLPPDLSDLDVQG